MVEKVVVTSCSISNRSSRSNSINSFNSINSINSINSCGSSFVIVAFVITIVDAHLVGVVTVSAVVVVVVVVVEIIVVLIVVVRDKKRERERVRQKQIRKENKEKPTIERTNNKSVEREGERDGEAQEVRGVEGLNGEAVERPCRHTYQKSFLFRKCSGEDCLLNLLCTRNVARAWERRRRLLQG